MPHTLLTDRTLAFGNRWAGLQAPVWSFQSRGKHPEKGCTPSDVRTAEATLGRYFPLFWMTSGPLLLPPAGRHGSSWHPPTSTFARSLPPNREEQTIPPDGRCIARSATSCRVSAECSLCRDQR